MTTKKVCVIEYKNYIIPSYMLTYSVWKILFKTNLYLHNLIPKK